MFYTTLPFPFSKDILMNGKIDKNGVFLQIVNLKINRNSAELELSDTINKTYPIKLNFNKPTQLKLYQVPKIYYNVIPVKRNDKYIATKYVFFDICLPIWLLIRIQSLFVPI